MCRSRRLPNAEGAVAATIANNTAVSATAMNDADLQLLEGTVPVFSIDFATSLVDGAAPNASATPTQGTSLGAVSLATDFTAMWTFGINADNRSQALWFETL